MEKRVAVMAVNPVNGYGLFQYLEAFFENKIPFTVYAVAESKTIKTNSGLTLVTDGVIADLKGHSGDYEALVFSCGDAMPTFAENISKNYNQDMLAVIKEFGEAGKLIAGHCVGGLLFDIAGITKGRTVAALPFVQSAIKGGKATNEPYAIDGKLYTAQTENTLSSLIALLVSVLK